MSFQAYIENIQKKTGKSPEDFKKLAEAKGFLHNGTLTVKATEVTNWLKSSMTKNVTHWDDYKPCEIPSRKTGTSSDH